MAKKSKSRKKRKARMNKARARAKAQKAAKTRKATAKKSTKKSTYRPRRQGLDANKKRIEAQKKANARKAAADRARKAAADRKAAAAKKAAADRAQKAAADRKAAETKSRDQKMRDAARKRNETFNEIRKKTGVRVQTFGGTRKNYTTKEAEAIRDAGLNFSKVTGGAKNPLNVPANPNVKPGPLMPAVTEFNSLLGTDKFYSNLAGSLKVNPFAAKPDSSISFSDAVKAGSRLAINRSNNDNRYFKYSPKVNYDFDSRDKSRDVSFRDMFQAKDLGNMTTNFLSKYIPGLNITPQSMSARDRQSYLGFNPNKPSRYLKATDPGRPKSQRQGTGNYIEPEAVQQQIVEPEPPPPPPPLEDTTVEDTTPTSLAGLQQDAYNDAMKNFTPTLPKNFDGTGGTGGSGVMGGISDAVIQQLMAGNRGKKRFRYGTGRRRGADNMLQRDSMRFKPFTTKGQLNI